VERALAHLPGSGEGRVVADVGTGSGAIAIAIAQARTGARVFATDISEAALAVAADNARRIAVGDRVRFVHGTLLDGLPDGIDLVCANLPYIPTGNLPDLPVSVRAFEPIIALDGGPDGLDTYRALLRELPPKVSAGAVVLMECDPGQAPTLLDLATRALSGATGAIVKDLAGDARVVEIALPAKT
jgi:release factor glutamine methyltransferase